MVDVPLKPNPNSTEMIIALFIYDYLLIYVYMRACIYVSVVNDDLKTRACSPICRLITRPEREKGKP